jgi:hypothetical protein
MEAKEKAQELVDKMYGDELDYMTEGQAKQCALIAVDEILNEYPNVKPMIVYFTHPRERFWQEVKKEIENL